MTSRLGIQSSPSITSARARCGPTSGSSQVPPESGTRPILAKDWMNRAETPAMTMSQAKARFAPAPAATPFTAAKQGSAARGSPGPAVIVTIEMIAEIGDWTVLGQSLLKILAGAECASVSSKDDAAERFVLGQFERRGELAMHSDRECIHAGRPVQLYDKAITIAFDNNEFSQALPQS